VRLRRLLLASAVAGAAVVAGGLWQPVSGSAAPSKPDGRHLWLGNCAFCHGARGQGSDDAPAITDSGTASVDFMVRTGRMPLAKPHDTMRRTTPRFDEQEIRALVAYTATFVQGPEASTPSSHGTSLQRGGALYLENCAACHQSVGAGGALAYGDVAPPLYRATPREIGEAVRTGPGNMPSFGGVLDDRDLADVTAYVRHLREPGDRGGFDLGHLGPVPEGLVALAGGLVVLVAVTRWLGTRVADES
jgi:ubiquinol-cytochrome c reductase cytochrome c subunit